MSTTVVNRQGADRVLQLSLTETEADKLRHSASVMKGILDRLLLD